MKKQILPPARYALLTACLLSGFAHAQSINFTGDTNPTGSLGASHSTTGVVVGNSGTGTLSIQNGGQLRSEAGMIAQQAGSNGAVVVEGANSSWEVAAPGQPRLTVGDGGSATLQVRNGAKVSSSSQLMSSYTAGSSSLIEIDGANSALTSETCAFGKASTLRISDGGLLYCRAGSEMAAGTVTLSGAGSKWAVDQVLGLGDGQPTSTTVVTLGEGTVLASRDIAMGYGDDSNTINIEGSTTPGAILAEDIHFSNRSVININHSDTSGNYVLGGIIHGGLGTINVNQAGTTSLTGNNSYRGLTNVRAGVLRAGAASGFSSESDFVVASGATLDTATFSPTIQSLDNGGTVTLAAGGTSGVLTVAQNYTGNGGVIAMNTVLGADDAATEMLVVRGDTSGSTTLNISNLGGTGAATTGDGIMVVQVGRFSNGTFSLPAPGYVVAGGFRYALAKVGNDWYLQSDVHVEASGPEASVVCTPAELSDTANQVATCTVTLTAAPTADLPINLVLPAANPRYTTTCASPMVVAANATQASCTITATPNTTAGDGDVSLELAIAPPSTADAYTPAGPAAQVLIKDAGSTTQPPTTLKQVPTLGSWGLAALAALMGLLGLHRSRKTA